MTKNKIYRGKLMPVVALARVRINTIHMGTLTRWSLIATSCGLISALPPFSPFIYFPYQRLAFQIGFLPAKISNSNAYINPWPASRS
jgi:hypothetical protein